MPKKSAPKKKDELSLEPIEGIEEKNVDEEPIEEKIEDKEENKTEKLSEEKIDKDEPIEEEVPVESPAEKPSFYQKVIGEEKPKSDNKKLFLLGAVVFLITVGVASFGFIMFVGVSGKEIVIQKSKEIEPTQIPTPTTIPATMNKEDLEFEVLNGSGTAGVAAKASDKIKALGYSVVKVGNAEENVDATEIYVAKAVSKEDIQTVLTDLEEDFGKLEVTGTLNDSDASIRLILSE